MYRFSRGWMVVGLGVFCDSIGGLVDSNVVVGVIIVFLQILRFGQVLVVSEIFSQQRKVQMWFLLFGLRFLVNLVEGGGWWFDSEQGEFCVSVTYFRCQGGRYWVGLGQGGRCLIGVVLFLYVGRFSSGMIGLVQRLYDRERCFFFRCVSCLYRFLRVRFRVLCFWYVLGVSCRIEFVGLQFLDVCSVWLGVVEMGICFIFVQAVAMTEYEVLCFRSLF